MKNAQSQKLILGMLCVVVFAVVFYQFSWKARASTLDKASDVRAATAVKRSDLIAAQKAQEQKPANDAALAQARIALPATADAQSVIRQLTQLAGTSGVTWENVTLGEVDEATKDSGLQALPLSVTITGKMAAVETYLANIRGAEVGRLIVVDAVTTNFGTDVNDPETVTALLTMKAFMYANATTAAGPTASSTTPTTVGSGG